MAALDLLWLAVGLVLLAFGGEMVVRGASGLARRLGVSPMMIGLTIVARIGAGSPPRSQFDRMSTYRTQEKGSLNFLCSEDHRFFAFHQLRASV